MSVKQLIQQIKKQPDSISFNQVMQVIDSCYDYQPSGFSNGCGDDTQKNPAGSNEGSCKIFAFAQLNQLDEAQTLACFGDYYRHDVLQNPKASDHANIRNFMRCGWSGVEFDQFPLRPKN